MANYALFKHVELYNVGSGKRRVLKPGGVSNDIFAVSDTASTPRSIKNHMKSNIFAAPSPVRNSTVLQGLNRYFFMGDARRPQLDSHNRLFGDADRPCTPAGSKNRLKSNIPLGTCDEADSSLKHSNGNVHPTNSSREHINGSENGKNGNSLNGETIKPSVENVAPRTHVINKNRIPPGGFSSALW